MQPSPSIETPVQPPGSPTRALVPPRASGHAKGSAATATAEARQSARVAVITRTRERPFMLRRCMASVLGQSFQDWLHVIVNDGGDPAVVELLAIEHADRYRGRMHVIHNPTSVGMQNASNIGIAEAAGDYLVIHDDDDSWQPEFLRACVGFLDERGAASSMQGVITQTIRVLEEFNADGGMDVNHTEDYMPCRGIDLFAAGSENPFAPIAFVYRRAVHERIGYFDERFSVLGDWDFNLRFLQQFDIGVLNQRLANYHWRHQSGGTVYANTVTGALDVHVEKSTQLRNHYLRMDLQAGQQGLGYLLNFARILNGHSAQLWELRHRADRTLEETTKTNTRLRRWEWFVTRNPILRPPPKPGVVPAKPQLGRSSAVSLPAPRSSADELAALLAGTGTRCRVLSLDVFDTALLRMVRRPTDAFLFLEAPVRRQLGVEQLPVASMRISAEGIARNRQKACAGHDEVTLAEIYTVFCELAKVDPDTHLDALMQLEMETEQHLLYGNPPVLAAARSAVQAGIRVVYASDMYLPRAFILDRLRQHGYPVDDATTLFLSAERGASKHVGTLYDQMLDELGCAPGEIVHVGDNLHSDDEQARSRGLRAVHWQASIKPEDLPLVEQRTGSTTAAFVDGDLLASVCLGVIRRRDLARGVPPPVPGVRQKLNGEHPLALPVAGQPAGDQSNGSAGKNPAGAGGAGTEDLWDRLGYEVGGPLYLLFSRWLLAQAQAEGLERLYFLARDGYYLRQACDLLTARAGLDIQSVYMAASRRLLNLSQITSLDAAAYQFLITPNPNLSVRHFLGRIGLDPAAFDGEIRRAGWSSPDEVITISHGGFRSDADFLAIRGLFRKLESQILRQAGEERRRLKAYFRRIGFSEDHHQSAIVDVGWQASSARALQTLLNLPDDRPPRAAPSKNHQGNGSNGVAPHRLRAFYFGTWHYAKPTVEAGCRLSSFYFHLDEPAVRRNLVAEYVEVIELFFGAPHPTITGLREEADGGFAPVYGECEHGDEATLARLRRMRERAVDFVRDATAVIPAPGPHTAAFLEWPGSGLNYLDATLERILRHPTLAEARQIGALQSRDSFGGNSPTRALARVPSRWQRLRDRDSLRYAYDHAFWKRGFLAQLSAGAAAKLLAR